MIEAGRPWVVQGLEHKISSVDHHPQNKHQYDTVRAKHSHTRRHITVFDMLGPVNITDRDVLYHRTDIPHARSKPARRNVSQSYGPHTPVGQLLGKPVHRITLRTELHLSSNDQQIILLLNTHIKDR